MFLVVVADESGEPAKFDLSFSYENLDGVAIEKEREEREERIASIEKAKKKEAERLRKEAAERKRLEELAI